MSTNQPDPGADGTPSEELEIMTDADIDEATSGLSAIQTLLALPQADDAGAQTADRYDWQAAMAAADGLALHLLWQNNHFAGQDPDELKIIVNFTKIGLFRWGRKPNLYRLSIEIPPRALGRMCRASSQMAASATYLRGGLPRTRSLLHAWSPMLRLPLVKPDILLSTGSF